MEDLSGGSSKQSAPTKGPWHFDAGRDNEYESENVYGTILDSHGDLHIARIWADGPDPEGHARLIAAAPELAEALRFLLDTEQMDDDEPPLVEARKVARAVLAKVDASTVTATAVLAK